MSWIALCNRQPRREISVDNSYGLLILIFRLQV
jgi:hypothetical protein